MTTHESGERFVNFVVRSVGTLAERVKAFRIEPLNGGTVAPWRAGAHIDIRLNTGHVRQYSLCGEQVDVHGYTIAVLLDPAGRGGSVAMHQLEVGDVVDVRGPRNNFELVPASRYIFLVGGIGITPVLPMIRHAAESGVPWRLVYGARNDTAFAFRSELVTLHGGSARFVAEDVDGRIDIAAELSDVDSSVGIYSCGPAPMLDALTAVASALGIEPQLHVERFAGSGDTTPVHLPSDSAFEVELARCGTTVMVGHHQTIVDAVLPVRPDLPYSCLEGYCGTCETSVLAGIPDHRDEYLSEDERRTNTTMLICVGRSQSARLVLDL